MKIQEVKRQVRLREWAEQINGCKQSGLTVKQWCKDNGISIKTYYNRMKRVREELLGTLETESGARLLGLVQPDRVITPTQQELTGRPGSLPPKQLATPVFAALPMPRTDFTAVTVHIGDHVAEIHNGADSAVMENVLRTLSQL